MVPLLQLGGEGDRREGCCELGSVAGNTPAVGPGTSNTESTAPFASLPAVGHGAVPQARARMDPSPVGSGAEGGCEGPVSPGMEGR